MSVTAPTRSASPSIGVDHERPDVRAKISGEFEFSNDAVAPGMLFGATVRSPHPHARIVAIDTRAALAMEGVVTILTADDVPGDRIIGHITADQPVFAFDRVRYEGEPIAFVVATSQRLAWRAADAVTVEYSPLPVLTDPEAALDPDAPLLHPDGNLVRRLVIDHGSECHGAEVEVSGTWWTGRQDQAFLGPESGLARPDPDGGVTVLIATQDLHLDQVQIAAALGIDTSLVRVVCGGVGGAFGGREDVTCQIHLALAALLTGRPVKTTFRRRESFLAHPKRHPARLGYRIGADRDGTLRYVWARIRLDGGAYASTSMPVIGVAAYFAAGPYRFDGVDIVGESVYTNNPVSGAMRGFGAVQACFGIESTLDLLAAELDIDPVELRRRNALRPGDRFPTSGQIVGPSAPVIEVIERCAALPLPEPSPQLHPYARPGGTGLTTLGEGVRRGVGFAVGVKHMLYGEGTPEWCDATVRLSSGGVEVLSAAVEVGQGITAVLESVAREELEPALGEIPIRVGPASTAAGYAGSSSASRQTWMSAGAVRAACRDLLAKLDLAVVSDVGWEQAVTDQVIAGEATYRPRATEAGDPTTGRGDVHVAWMFVAHRAVVDVDVELGTVKVVQIATSQDVGRAVHPREVHGQILGGIAQGLGLALNEELRVHDGIALNPSFTDYLVPTAADMPEVLVDLVEVAEPEAPYGLKGVGEPPSLSSTPAIAAAIRAASGAPLRRVPIRPDDIVTMTATSDPVEVPET